MEIRRYQPSDCEAMAGLFYETVHHINAGDYSEEQLKAWAPGTVDLEKWNASFQEHDTVIAVEGEQITGFGDMDSTGYLDRLYVHKDYQRRGIASAICNELERHAKEAFFVHHFVTHASITARPFFEKRGYRVVKEQQVERRGVLLTNYVMEKFLQGKKQDEEESDEMEKNRLIRIREAEKESHDQIYSSAKLYEAGSWLCKPVKTVLELLPHFAEYEELRILDLGCGVGRNCIPIARAYSNISCKIEGVDLLETAIAGLRENAARYHVEKYIKGILSPLEAYPIAENSYDLIMAISALEHIDSEVSFRKKLAEIRKGIRANGIVCLVINSGVTERDSVTKEVLFPQFEVNMPTEQMKALLKKCFEGWEIKKLTVKEQRYEIPRRSGMAELNTSVVTLVAVKNQQ